MVDVTSISAVELTSRTGKTMSISGVRSLDGNNFFRFCHDGRQAYVPQNLFVTKLEARRHLQSQDIVITDDRLWRDITSAIEEVPSFAPEELTERLGWTGPYFTDQTGRVYTPDGHRPARSTLPRMRRPAKGTFRYWKANVASPLTGQHLPMLAILSALAAPLLAIIGEAQNIGFEFSGPPGTGKTTCLRLLASVAGDPAQIPNFNATLAGLERLFAEHSDLPLPVDEANLINQGDAQFLKDFAFRMANGTMRLTAFQSDHQRYRFVFVTTSNRPFYEGLRGFDSNTADAALQRLIPIRVPDHALGVFDFLPAGFATSGALAAHLIDAITRSHGRVMPRLIKALVNARAIGETAFKDAILRDIHVFEQTIGVSDTVRGKTRASSAFGLLYAAGELAKVNRILPSQWDCLAACVAGYRNYQSQLPHHTPVPVRLLAVAQRPQTLDLRDRPLPQLSDEEVKQHGAFIKVGVRGRVELLLTSTVLRANFPDWSTLKHKLMLDGSVIREPEHDCAHRQVRLGKKRERFYCFVMPHSIVQHLHRR